MYKDLKFIKEYNNQLNNIKENINDILNGYKIASQFDKNLFNSQKQKELYQLKFPDLQFIKIIITQKTNIQTYLLHHKSEFSLQSLYFYIKNYNSLNEL